MNQMPPRSCFLDSLKRCNESPEFISAFYKRFLSSSEDIRYLFRNTDFARQEMMLRDSLALIADATEGDTWGLIHLRERARSHSRAHLNIEPRFYELWLDACIDTAEAHDPQWSPDIEQAWRLILGYGIKEMTRYY